MAEVERQRFSFWGFVGLIAVAVIVSIFVQMGNLAALYWLATVALIGIMLAVAFDLGVGKSSAVESQVATETEPDETVAPSAEPSAPAPVRPVRRKRRKKRKR